MFKYILENIQITQLRFFLYFSYTNINVWSKCSLRIFMGMNMYLQIKKSIIGQKYSILGTNDLFGKSVYYRSIILPAWYDLRSDQS